MLQTGGAWLQVCCTPAMCDHEQPTERAPPVFKQCLESSGNGEGPSPCLYLWRPLHVRDIMFWEAWLQTPTGRLAHPHPRSLAPLHISDLFGTNTK